MRRPEDCAAGAPSKWGGLGEDNIITKGERTLANGGSRSGPFVYKYTGARRSDDIPEWGAPRITLLLRTRGAGNSGSACARRSGTASPPRQVSTVSCGILIASNCPGLNYIIRQERL